MEIIGIMFVLLAVILIVVGIRYKDELISLLEMSSETKRMANNSIRDTNSLNEINKEISDLREKISKIEESNNRFKTSSSSDVNNIVSNINQKINAEVKGINDQINGFNNSLDAIIKKISNIEKRIATLEENLECGNKGTTPMINVVKSQCKTYYVDGFNNGDKPYIPSKSMSDGYTQGIIVVEILSENTAAYYINPDQQVQRMNMISFSDLVAPFCDIVNKNGTTINHINTVSKGKLSLINEKWFIVEKCKISY